jgi:outer membrane protein OmpA-like peptidoglycan-associated protein
MSKSQKPSPSTFLAVALSVAVAAAVVARGSGLIEPAQAQSDAEKKKREQERQKTAPPKPQPQPPSAKPPAYKPPPAPPRATAPPPPPPKTPLQKQSPPPEKPAKSFQQPPPPAAKTTPKTTPGGPPPGLEPKKEGIRRLPPPPSKDVTPAPPKGPPPAVKEAVPPAVKKAVPPVAKTPAPGPVPKRIDEVQKGRLERVEGGGRFKVFVEPGPGKRLIVKERDRSIIRHDETARFLRRPGAKSERRADGNVETVYVRPDGVRIVTVVDARGRLLRRYRRDRDGRERSIIDNRRFYVGVGIGIGIGIIALNLPPPRVTIPRERYIVDYESASDDDLDEALTASPIEPLERAYSLDEIRYNYELRARMRRIDLDAINFEFGAWEVPPDQYDRLERVAHAILRVLRDNPEAVFLIEAYTDAVGSEEDNLSLSDRRAQSVAEILSETFDVPPENLVTQGYGEQYLKIDTQGPEPRNRIVIIRNITALMAER